MPDRILKPDSGNDLILQNDDASAKIEINEDGSMPVTGTLEGNMTVGSGKTLDVSSGTLTTSSAQKQAIVQAGPGSGTFDVSSGTFTTSSTQKTAIVDGGKGNLAASDVGLGNVTNESKATMFTSPTFTGNSALGSNATGTFNGAIGSSATGLTGIKEADQFRVTTSLTGSTVDITTNWERVDDASFGKIGTGMTESSGIFTFPQTGTYLVLVFVTFKSTNGEQHYGGIEALADMGSGYDSVAQSFNGMFGSNAWSSTSLNFFFNVTNTSNDKVKFSRAASSGSAVSMVSSTSTNYNSFTFIRMGDDT